MFQRFSCRDSAVASSETGCARVVVGLGVHVRVQAVKSRHSLVAVMLSYPLLLGMLPLLSWDNHSSTFVAL